MSAVSINARLRKIEARRAKAVGPVLTKQQRDARTAAAAVLPGAEAHALSALAAERDAMTRDRSAAAIAAFWRADT